MTRPTLQLCTEEDLHRGYDAPLPAESEEDVLEPALTNLNAREWLLSGLEIPVNMTWAYGAVKAVRTLGRLLAYADDVKRMCAPKHRRKDVTSEELDALAQQWLECLVTMATAHDPEPRTRVDETTDALLRPLLTMPMPEVRSFTRTVARLLKEDARVPFLVWSSFSKIVEPVVLKGADGEAVELAQALAWEVAELALPKLPREELIQSMADAMQWRSPATLQKVKTALESPTSGTPRLRGRQSCLFLEIPQDDGTTAMVVL